MHPHFKGMKLLKKQYDYDFHIVPALASCDSLITSPHFCNILISNDLQKYATAAAIPVKIKSLTKYKNYIIN